MAKQAPAPRAPQQASAKPAAATQAGRSVSRLKVRATFMGYYEHVRRRVGDVFRLSDPKHFTSRWMEYVDPATPEKTTTAQEALAQEHQSIIRRASGQPDNPPDGRGVLGEE